MINQGIGSNVLTPECPAYEYSAKPSALERVESDEEDEGGMGWLIPVLGGLLIIILIILAARRRKSRNLEESA